MIGKVAGDEMPEIGYIFHPDYRGQGFAHEAMVAVVDPAFANRAVEYLRADIDPRNDASRRLLQKLGFHYTRHARNTICSDGVWADSNCYALPRPGPKKESI